MTIPMECHGCGEQWEAMPESNAKCPKCHITSVGRRPLFPAEPTTAEAFAILRSVGHGPACSSGVPCGLCDCDHAERASALALLERRMQDNPSLAVLVEAFCLDVEAAESSQEAKRRGGQQVPFHGPFCHLQPSVRGELNRWARDFREALKK